jgi:phospholipid/cholesterol/gamma-HCH transport system permease protein
MTTTVRSLTTQLQLASLESSPNGTTLRLAGDWRLPHVDAAAAALSALAKSSRVVALDGRALTGFDTAGALVVLRYLQGLGTDPKSAKPQNFAPHHRRILEVVSGQLGNVTGAAQTPQPGFFQTIGRNVVALWDLIVGHVQFFGYTAAGVGALLTHPRRLRLKELAAQFEQVGITAIPVVLLVTFLIGVVFAYLLGVQAEKYGASIFVVDGVAIGMAREFSPLLVAVIIAGRSGAAFTAQLGTMRLTEETDAIRVLGLSPMDVLILPRLFALIVALPLLVFVGDVVSNFGGMLMADQALGIVPATYIDRLHKALRLKDVIVGLVKAPVFAFFIAIIGMRMGMTVSSDTRSIGINTTSTVVQGIVSVILLDALFAVVFQKLGI